MDIIGNYCRRIKSWITAQILVHKNISDAHHTKYTDIKAVDAMGAKADDNPLHHDKATEWGAAEHTTIGDNAPHHAKYLDNDAIAAVYADDKYVRLTGDVMSGDLTINKGGARYKFITPNNSIGAFQYSDDTGLISEVGFYGSGMGAGYAGQLYFWAALNNVGEITFWTKEGGVNKERVTYENGGKMNMRDNILKNPKNHAHSALSGTKKLVEIDIEGVPYYYEVYPTKA